MIMMMASNLDDKVMSNDNTMNLRGEKLLHHSTEVLLCLSKIRAGAGHWLDKHRHPEYNDTALLRYLLGRSVHSNAPCSLTDVWICRVVLENNYLFATIPSKEGSIDLFDVLPVKARFEQIAADKTSKEKKREKGRLRATTLRLVLSVIYAELAQQRLDDCGDRSRAVSAIGASFALFLCGYQGIPGSSQQKDKANFTEDYSSEPPCYQTIRHRFQLAWAARDKRLKEGRNSRTRGNMLTEADATAWCAGTATAITPSASARESDNEVNPPAIGGASRGKPKVDSSASCGKRSRPNDPESDEDCGSPSCRTPGPGMQKIAGDISPSSSSRGTDKGLNLPCSGNGSQGKQQVKPASCGKRSRPTDQESDNDFGMPSNRTPDPGTQQASDGSKFNRTNVVVRATATQQPTVESGSGSGDGTKIHQPSEENCFPPDFGEPIREATKGGRTLDILSGETPDMPEHRRPVKVLSELVEDGGRRGWLVTIEPPFSVSFVKDTWQDTTENVLFFKDQDIGKVCNKNSLKSCRSLSDQEAFELSNGSQLIGTIRMTQHDQKTLRSVNHLVFDIIVPFLEKKGCKFNCKKPLNGIHELHGDNPGGCYAEHRDPDRTNSCSDIDSPAWGQLPSIDEMIVPTWVQSRDESSAQVTWWNDINDAMQSNQKKELFTLETGMDLMHLQGPQLQYFKHGTKGIGTADCFRNVKTFRTLQEACYDNAKLLTATLDNGQPGQKKYEERSLNVHKCTWLFLFNVFMGNGIVVFHQLSSICRHSFFSSDRMDSQNPGMALPIAVHLPGPGVNHDVHNQEMNVATSPQEEDVNNAIAGHQDALGQSCTILSDIDKTMAQLFPRGLVKQVFKLPPDTWPRMRGLDSIMPMIKPLKLLGHHGPVSDLLTSSLYLGRWMKMGYYLEVFRKQRHKNTATISTIKLATHGLVDPDCPPGTVVDIRKSRLEAGMRTTGRMDKCWSSDYRRLNYMEPRHAYKNGAKEMNAMVCYFKDGPRARTDDQRLVTCLEGGAAATAGTFGDSGGIMDSATYTLPFSQRLTKHNKAVHEACGVYRVVDHVLGHEWLPEDFPIPASLKHLERKHLGLHMGKWVCEKIVYREKTRDELLKEYPNVPVEWHPFIRFQECFHYECTWKPLLEEEMVLQMMREKPDWKWKQVTLDADDKLDQVRMPAPGGLASLTLDASTGLTHEDLANHFFQNEIMNYVVDPDLEDGIADEAVEDDEHNEDEQDDEHDEDDECAEDEAAAATSPASEKAIGRSREYFAPSLMDLSWAAARQNVAGAYRFKRFSLVETKQKSIPLIGLSGMFGPLGFVLRTRAFPMSNRLLDTDTMCMVQESGILDREIVGEDDCPDRRWARSELTFDQFELFLFWSVLLQHISRLDRFARFCDWMRDRGDDRVGFFLPRLSDVPAFIEYVKGTTAETKRMTQWLNGRHMGSIANKLKTEPCFTLFLKSLVGLEGRESQLRQLATKLWELRAPGRCPDFEDDTRDKAVHILYAVLIQRYDCFMWGDKNEKASAMHMASRITADMEEMTKDIFGPCIIVHPGKGASAGLKHIKRWMLKTGMFDSDPDDQEAMKKMLENLKASDNDLLACRGYARRSDGTVVCAGTGRPVTLKEPEHESCECAHRAAEAAFGTRASNVAKTMAAHCYPQIRKDIFGEKVAAIMESIVGTFEKLAKANKIPAVPSEFMKYTERQLSAMPNYRQLLEEFDNSWQVKVVEMEQGLETVGKKRPSGPRSRNPKKRPGRDSSSIGSERRPPQRRRSSKCGSGLASVTQEQSQNGTLAQNLFPDDMPLANAKPPPCAESPLGKMALNSSAVRKISSNRHFVSRSSFVGRTIQNFLGRQRK